MISVLILTLNEQANLPRCLESVKWSDDIVILESGSSDQTLEIARQYGARIYHRPFDNERDHRTYSLREIDYKYPWVYNPDADEVTTEALRDEMHAVVQDPRREEVAYRCRFKNMFMGQWLKYSSLYPTWVMRLFQPDKISFRRSINLHYQAEGKEGRLQSHFLHYSFNKGFAAWFYKHNMYSSFEAEETRLEMIRGRMDWSGLFCVSDGVRRRRALKSLSLRMPLRPMARFIYMYIVRAGFLDGKAGLTYCILLSIYEYMIVLKVREARLREKNLSL